MARYQDRLKEHLGRYRIDSLRVKKKGLYRKDKQPRSHILPEEQRELNILPDVREDFWKDFPKWEIRLHRDFHHLNSSQAMCFNLFYPFFGSRKSAPEVVLAELGLGGSAALEWRFEHEPDPGEGTNFDFYLMLEDEREIFFEIKLTEPDFGAGRIDERRTAKLKDIYRPALESLVSPGALEEGFFFKHYQLLRNVSYLSKCVGSTVFLVFPRENAALKKPLDELVEELLPEARERLRVIYLEDLVAGLRARVEETNPFLREHLDQFSEKYLSS